MNLYGRVIEPRAARFERLLPGPIERLWAYLTEPDKRSRWLAGGTVDLTPDGLVEMQFKHADLSPITEEIPDRYRQHENAGRCTGRVTRCEPPRLLSHTWDDGGDEPSEVTFELTPRGDEVLLVLTHRRLDLGHMVQVAGGWHTHLGILLAHLNGEVPQPFWATFGPLEDEYRQRLTAASMADPTPYSP